MQKQIVLLTTVLVLAVSSVYGQKTEQDSTYKKFFIGSSLFILANLNINQANPPDFFQLNFGYRITPNDVVSIEAKTWKYSWPLGIPYGKSFEAPEEKYPGYIRDLGIGLVYQRFLWKGAYASVDAMNTFQRYVDEDNRTIQKGYLLFMTYRLGYHFQLIKNRFFIEPSVSMTHWPIKTNVPESFARLDNKWPNYFLLEPGLHFGYKF